MSIIMRGRTDVGTEKGVRKSVIAGVCFSQMSVIFVEDLAAVLTGWASVKARCPQGES